MAVRAANQQVELIRTGERATGVVVDVPVPFRGSPGVTYRYTVDAREYTGSIRGTRGNYDISERVTVYVDPAHPEHSTLPGERPQSAIAMLFTLAMFTLALLAFGAVAARGIAAVRNRGSRARRPAE